MDNTKNDAEDQVQALGADDDQVQPEKAADEPAVGAVAPKPAATAPVDPSPAEFPATRSGGGRGIALLALFLALGAGAFSGWLWLQQQAREQGLSEREAALASEVQKIAETAEGARRAIGEAIDASRQATLEVSQRLADERSRYTAQMAEQQAALKSLEASQRSQRQQLIELRSTDRVDWTLAEAEYLLRLAYQRLLMAEDVSSAKALLASADGILRELDDTALYPAREAIATDLAALRAVPDLDVEGAWLRLNALAGRVDQLILFELPEFESSVEPVAEDAGWRERLGQGWRSALDKVSRYFRIRRDAEPYQALMDPQWEQLVRQNLRMQIAQTQAALLSGNATLYRSSIANVQRWVAEFFRYNEAEVAAMNEELAELADVPVERELPDIGDSLMAVRAAIDERHAADGG